VDWKGGATACESGTSTRILSASTVDEDEHIEAWQKGRVVTEFTRPSHEHIFMQDVQSSLPHREVITDDNFEFTEILMDADQLVLLEVLSWLSPLFLMY
jgi:hypothetical protein